MKMATQWVPGPRCLSLLMTRAHGADTTYGNVSFAYTPQNVFHVLRLHLMVLIISMVSMFKLSLIDVVAHQEVMLILNRNGLNNTHTQALTVMHTQHFANDEEGEHMRYDMGILINYIEGIVTLANQALGVPILMLRM